MSIRLNKLLARRGIGARRKCDLLIQQGRVRVNGQVVREPGTMVEPERDRIEVAGRSLPPPAEHRYYVLNKPVGVISTLDDPEGRRTVREFLPPGPRLFPVGRLDADTSGLLMLTNDGELAHRLMHPRYGVEKVYRVWLDHAPSNAQLARLRDGVEFEPGIVSEPARVRALQADGERGLIEISIHEGRYRQVRRMCEAVGLQVTGLHRWAYGPVRLGVIERGMWRELSHEEVTRLRAASARPRPRSRTAGREFFSARRGLVRSRQESAAARDPRRAPQRPSRMRARSERAEHPRRRSAPPERGPRDHRPSSERDTARARFERPRREPGATRGRLERPRREPGAAPRRFERPRRDLGSPPRRLERPPRRTDFASDRERTPEPRRPSARPGRSVAEGMRRFGGSGRPPRERSGRGAGRPPRERSGRGASRPPRERSGPDAGRSPRAARRTDAGQTRRRVERPSSPTRGRGPLGQMPRGAARQRSTGRSPRPERPRRRP